MEVNEGDNEDSAKKTQWKKIRDYFNLPQVD